MHSRKTECYSKKLHAEVARIAA